MEKVNECTCKGARTLVTNLETNVTTCTACKCVTTLFEINVDDECFPF